MFTQPISHLVSPSRTQLSQYLQQQQQASKSSGEQAGVHQRRQQYEYRYKSSFVQNKI
jgi:hypothetical protein